MLQQIITAPRNYFALKEPRGFIKIIEIVWYCNILFLDMTDWLIFENLLSLSYYKYIILWIKAVGYFRVRNNEQL